MAAMAFYPDPVDLVRRACRIQTLPQVDVLHWLLVGRAPAILLPAVDPFGDAFAQVVAVGVEPHLARPLQCLQPTDGGHQLHAVVGGGGLAARQLALAAAQSQNRGPAARARVSAAGAI